MHGHQLELDPHGLSDVATDGRHAQIVHQARCHVGRHADVACAAAQHQGHGSGVIAREHGELFGYIADQPLGAFDVAGGFLDTDDPGHLGQAQHGLVLQIGHGATGHVVKNNRQGRHSFSDGLEVLVQAFLGGSVVVGHHLQLGIGPYFLSKFGQFNGFCRGIGTTACNDGDAFSRLFHRDANDLAMLVYGHCR